MVEENPNIKILLKVKIKSFLDFKMVLQERRKECFYDFDLKRINLVGLTEDQITALPEELFVKGLSLSEAVISAENAMLLIAKLKPRGNVNLCDVNLSRLTEEQINALPDGLYVQDLDFYRTSISALNAMLLIAKLRPQGMLDFVRIDLSGLTKEQITALPEGISVKVLSFCETKISAENAMLLIAKLKPQGYLSLGYVDLSRLTEEQINTIPEGLSFQGINLGPSYISAANAMLLIAKLKPRDDVRLCDVNLSRLTEEQINRLPEGFAVKNLSLPKAVISAANAMLLIAKLRPQGILNFFEGRSFGAY